MLTELYRQHVVKLYQKSPYELRGNVILCKLIGHDQEMDLHMIKSEIPIIYSYPHPFNVNLHPMFDSTDIYLLIN